MTARLARAALERALAASEFLQRALQADPALFDESPEALGPCPEPRPDEQDAVIGWLRRWRRRHFAQIAARDIGGAATVEQTLQALSDVADEAVRTAYRHAWAATAARYGVPRGAAGEELPMVVVAMGKLGGSELNFSSDIDLVFLFPEAGETTGAAPVSHDEFYVRLGQSLIHLLAASTADGFAFRVDMRLRPFGDSGPLACSFASFEDYLLQQGRDWERYAWIKARAIVGARHYATLFAQAVRPFVFRRYLDYGVFESLREMKALIEKQVARRELHDDLKLGPGGIREIEFIVQALQLIRGGQDVRLQSPRLLEVLPLLARSRLLGSDAVGELRAAYLHLRLLENRLQMLRDAQTHRLPEDAASRAMLLAGLALQRWEELTAALEAHRAAVRRHFDALVFAPAQSAGAAARPEVAALLLQASGADDAASGLDAGLQSLGFAAAGDAARLLQAYRDGARVRRLDEPGRRRLQALLDALLPAIGRVPADEQLVLLRRVVQILEAIGQRSSYFALLNENASARARLLQVCRAGEFLAQQLEAFPLLLDELLDERLFARPPERAELAAELDERLRGIDPQDEERQHEALCQFKRAAQFRVAVADVSGGLPLMQVSDRLTDIAELIVDQALKIAWRQITAQYGTPYCGTGSERRPVAICAVGYGKLGGIELGYASDLDLVFLHDSSGESQETDATPPLDNQLFFVRLAQRIVHLLSMHSAAGRLYEVDTRLRPSGKGGMLITGIEAFRRYQQTEAWTWEHQALLHARPVAGDPALCARFAEVRLEIVTHYVKRDGLREEVRSMRERMRRELSKARPGQFDLKQDPGGIADIEFLAQYWTLLHAAERPAVAMFSDTIRQLESLASDNLVPQSTVDELTAAYRAYRARGHHRSLKDQAAVVPDSEFAAERAAVKRIWDATFAQAL